MTPPNLQYVSAEELRKLFNENRYDQLVNPHAVLTEKLIREGKAAPDSGQQPGTRSQVIAYLDGNGKQVAIVHQYVRPDGTLGGSGRPDPKKLLHNGVLYVLQDP
jgi:hypothetical protein